MFHRPTDLTEQRDLAGIPRHAEDKRRLWNEFTSMLRDAEVPLRDLKAWRLVR